MTSGGRGQVLEVLPAELVPAAEAAEAHWAPPSRRGTAVPQTGLAARFSGATLRAYQADWSTFASWCGARDVAVPPAPADQVAIYLAAAASATRSPHGGARYRAATVARWASSISAIHTSLGYPDPCAQPPARDVVAAIRGLREQASRHARPLLAGDLAVLLDCLPSPGWPTEPARRRDRLCVTLGFAAGLGPSALTGLTLADIEPASGSHALSVRGRTTGPAEPVLACPACAYASWRRLIDAVDDRGGPAAVQGMTGGDGDTGGHLDLPGAVTPPRSQLPLLRRIRRGGTVTDDPLTAQVVRQILRRLAASAGMDPQRVGGLSLRAGKQLEHLLEDAAGMRPGTRSRG